MEFDIEVQCTQWGKWRDSRPRWVSTEQPLPRPQNWEDMKEMAKSLTAPRRRVRYQDPDDVVEAVGPCQKLYWGSVQSSVAFSAPSSPKKQKGGGIKNVRGESYVETGSLTGMFKLTKSVATGGDDYYYMIAAQVKSQRRSLDSSTARSGMINCLGTKLSASMYKLFPCDRASVKPITQMEVSEALLKMRARFLCWSGWGER